MTSRIEFQQQLPISGLCGCTSADRTMIGSCYPKYSLADKPTSQRKSPVLCIRKCHALGKDSNLHILDLAVLHFLLHFLLLTKQIHSYTNIALDAASTLVSKFTGKSSGNALSTRSNRIGCRAGPIDQRGTSRAVRR